MNDKGKKTTSTGIRKPAASQPFDKFEEKRKYPRVVVNRPVEIRLGTRVLQGVLHDISPDGLQLRCDRETLEGIHPSGASIEGNSGPLIKVFFTLPIGRRDKRVEAEVRLYYFVLLAQEKPPDVAFGARFSSLAQESQGDLDAYFRDALQPVEDSIIALLDEPRTIAEIAEQLRIGLRHTEETLLRMKDTHHFMELQSGSQVRYVQLDAALRLLFKRIADLERRLQNIE